MNSTIAKQAILATLLTSACGTDSVTKDQQTTPVQKQETVQPVATTSNYNSGQPIIERAPETISQQQQVESPVAPNTAAPTVVQNQQPAYGNEQPAYGNEQPAYGNEQPAYGNEQPAYGNEQPAYGNEQPAYGNEQPAYGNGQPAYGNGQPAYGNEQPAYGNQQPAYGNNDLYVGYDHRYNNGVISNYQPQHQSYRPELERRVSYVEQRYIRPSASYKPAYLSEHYRGHRALLNYGKSFHDLRAGQHGWDQQRWQKTRQHLNRSNEWVKKDMYGLMSRTLNELKREGFCSRYGNEQKLAGYIKSKNHHDAVKVHDELLQERNEGRRGRGR